MYDLYIKYQWTFSNDRHQKKKKKDDDKEENKKEIRPAIMICGCLRKWVFITYLPVLRRKQNDKCFVIK